MEYEVLYVKSDEMDVAIDKLNIKVNDKLKEGWKLQGGVSVACATINLHRHNFTPTYIASQAMIKE